jgi:hypothetical protein
MINWLHCFADFLRQHIMVGAGEEQSFHLMAESEKERERGWSSSRHTPMT